MKHICRNCHFLCKEYRDEKGEVYSSLVSSQEREVAKNGNVDFVEGHYSLNCYNGVWDEGVAPNKEKRPRIVNEINRKEMCFFWPHTPAMLFKAAAELQKREQENKQLKRSNLYTRLGLWIAAIGSFFSAIISLIKE